MKRLLVFVAAATLSSLGSAAETDAYSGDNHIWDRACTPHGYKLTSRYPVGRYFEAGAGSHYIEERETLLLDENCRAQLNTLGEGEWCWELSGFYARFPDHCISFPRQELGSCPDGSLPEYDLACACGRDGGPPVDVDPLCRTPKQLIDRYRLQSPD